MLSLQRQFLLKPGASFSIMAAPAKRLPVVFVPEQRLIASVRDHKIHHGRGRELSLPHTLGAQRVPAQESLSRRAPAAVVAALGGIASQAIRGKRRVFAAVNAAVAQIRASRIPAGPFRRFRHISLHIKSSPRSSYTEPPFMFFMALSSAITSATAPSTFSVDFSLSILRLPAGSVRT